jgi:hypothetical protein
MSQDPSRRVLRCPSFAWIVGLHGRAMHYHQTWGRVNSVEGPSVKPELPPGQPYLRHEGQGQHHGRIRLACRDTNNKHKFGHSETGGTGTRLCPEGDLDCSPRPACYASASTELASHLPACAFPSKKRRLGGQ